MLRRRLMVNNTYYVIATYNGNGNIKLLGDGYNSSYIVDVIIDGVSVGPVKSYNFSSGGDHLVEIHFDPNAKDGIDMFRECPRLRNVDFTNYNMSKLVNIARMFYGDTDLPGVNFDNANWSSMEDINALLEDCVHLSKISLNNICSNRLRNMNNAFDNTSITKLDLSSLNLENVTQMNEMINRSTWVNYLKIMSPIRSDVQVKNFWHSWKKQREVGTFYYNHLYNYDVIPTPEGWSGIFAKPWKRVAV